MPSLFPRVDALKEDVVNNEYLHNAPAFRKFILRVDPQAEFPHFKPDAEVTLRCGLCGWTKKTTRGEFPGLHAKHRAEKHASA